MSQRGKDSHTALYMLNYELLAHCSGGGLLGKLKFLFLMEFEIRAIRAGSSLSVIIDVHHKKITVLGRPVVLRCTHLGKQTWWYIMSFVNFPTLLFSSSSVAPRYDAYVLMEFEGKFY